MFESSKKPANMPVDYFRDTWVRYLGYANEVGEALRGVVPTGVVRLSYKVAFGYVCADTLSKSLQSFRKDVSPGKVLFAAGDAFIWQTLASVVIPGYTINRICAVSNQLLSRHGKKIPPHIRSGLVVAIGLGSIPIIVCPIDMAVTVFMNLTYRQIFGKNP